MQDLQSGQVDVGRWRSWLLGLLSLLAGPVLAQDTLEHRSLDFYLEQGLLNSPLLKENTNAIGLNRLDSLINIAINKPYVQGIGQVLYAPASQRFGYDQNNTNGGLYSGIVQVNRNLLYRKNLRIQNTLNYALRDSLVNTIRINENDLQKSIIDLYLIAYQDYQQMTIFNDLFKILSRQNELVKSLLRSAIFAQSDYLAFRVDLQQSEINYEGAKIQYLQDLLTLNTLCNIPYGQLTVRYWLTVENPAPLRYDINYAQLGSDKVHLLSYVAQPRQQVSGYIEFSFDASAGNLGAMSNSGPIQDLINKQDYSYFYQGDDYSYINNGNFVPNPHITAYLNGQLIYGTEPPSAARQGAEPLVEPLQVRVLGNPVVDSQIAVAVSGIQGTRVRYVLTDIGGRLVDERQTVPTGGMDRQTLRLVGHPAGVYLLRVTTATQAQTVKVLKTE